MDKATSRKGDFFRLITQQISFEARGQKCKGLNKEKFKFFYKKLSSSLGKKVCFRERERENQKSLEGMVHSFKNISKRSVVCCFFPCRVTTNCLWYFVFFSHHRDRCRHCCCYCVWCFYPKFGLTDCVGELVYHHSRSDVGISSNNWCSVARFGIDYCYWAPK